jgi:hypothetical protein
MLNKKEEIKKIKNGYSFDWFRRWSPSHVTIRISAWNFFLPSFFLPFHAPFLLFGQWTRFLSFPGHCAALHNIGLRSDNDGGWVLVGKFGLSISLSHRDIVCNDIHYYLLLLSFCNITLITLNITILSIISVLYIYTYIITIITIINKIIIYLYDFKQG